VVGFRQQFGLPSSLDFTQCAATGGKNIKSASFPPSSVRARESMKVLKPLSHS